MSSLLSKFKRLVSARVRGPRRYAYKREAEVETDEGPTPLPEIVEAPAKPQRLPEVTEASEVDEAPTLRPASTSRPVSRIAAPERVEEETETLEEERIVDLLKGKKA